VALPATVTVLEGPVAGFLRVAGRLDFERVVRVGASLPGQLTAVEVDVGDAVKRGQLLARLDNVDQRSAVAAAGAQRQMAEAQVTRAELRLLENLPSSMRWHGDLPLDELLEGPAGDAQLDLIAAAAWYDKHDAALTLARGQLARRAIRAPIDGIVVGRAFERGETIAASPPGPPLFVIDARPGHLILRAEVADDYVSRVQTGSARVTFSSLPDRSFSGEVMGITAVELPSALPMTDARPRYEVRLAIDNPGGTLRPALAAEVDLPMSSPKGALRIPVAAVDRSAAAEGPPASRSRSIVWAVRGDRAPVPLQIQLGVSDGTYVEVSGPGVAPGLRVAVP